MTRATVADALTWLDLHNGSVQAAASVATLAATLLVALVAIGAAWAVGRQARQTGRLAALAQRQIEEAAEARRALVRPYLHVEGCAGGGVEELAVRLRVRNVGAGPALGVRGRLEHVQVVFEAGVWSDEEEPAGTLLAPGQTRELGFRSVKTEGAIGPLEPARLVVEYRDLADRRWATELPIKLERRIGPDGRAAVEPFALDGEEQVSPL